MQSSNGPHLAREPKVPDPVPTAAPGRMDQVSKLRSSQTGLWTIPVDQLWERLLIIDVEPTDLQQVSDAL